MGREKEGHVCCYLVSVLLILLVTSVEKIKVWIVTFMSTFLGYLNKI